MNLREVKTFTKEGEGQFIEFKKNTNSPQQILEEVAGFANSTGGNLFIGIADNGDLSGVKFAEDETNFLLGYLQDKIDPTPPLEFKNIAVNKSKSIIHIKIKSGSEKPYSIKSDSKAAKKVLFRTNHECIQASRELKGILKGRRLGKEMMIKYAEIEREVLRQLDKEGSLSKQDFLRNLGYKSRTISDCLIRLVLADVIRIIPTAAHDLYEFNEQN